MKGREGKGRKATETPRRPDWGSEPRLLLTLGTLPHLSKPHPYQSGEKSSHVHFLACCRCPGNDTAELGLDHALSATDIGVSLTSAGERGPWAAAGPPHSVAVASGTRGRG